MTTPSFTHHGDFAMLWITDPWSTLDHSQDTTLRLMQEAINLGIPTFWSDTSSVFSSAEYRNIKAVELKNSLNNLKQATFDWKEFSLSKFKQIHYRVDPPVDAQYCKIINELLLRGAQNILNPPDLIQFQSEKIPPPDLQEFSPRLKRVDSLADLNTLSLLFSKDSYIVSKPLNLAQSVGVKKHQTPQSESEWKNLLITLTQNFSEPVLIEEYLPEITEGETRLWFVRNHFIASLKKYPKKGDFRVLIDEGSAILAHQLTESEKNMAQKIGQSLKKQGIGLAAVDVIGNKICDYNITSPGLLVQLEAVHGNQNFAKKIMELLLNPEL